MVQGNCSAASLHMQLSVASEAYIHSLTWYATASHHMQLSVDFINIAINLDSYELSLVITRSIAALQADFSSSCGGLHPSASIFGPFKNVENPFGKF